MNRAVPLFPSVSLRGKLPGDIWLKREKAGDCRELHDEKFHETVLQQILFWRTNTMLTICGGGRKKSGKNGRGPAVCKGVPGPRCLAYAFVFLGSIILDQAQVTQQLTVRAGHTRPFLLINTNLG